MTRISWVNVALGVWLVIAAFALPHSSGAAITEDVVAGSVVALASLWAARAFRPTVSLIASWMVALTGLWILSAPFVLGYEGARPSVVNQVLIGCAVAVLGALNTRRKAALIDNR
jgi:hypothetical protein